MISLHLGSVRFDSYPEDRRCETVFADGTRVMAVPVDNDAYRATAWDLGYKNDTWHMCLEHELFHSLLACVEGWHVSPALWAVAHDTQAKDMAMIAREERRVLDFQKALNQARNG